MAVAGVVVVVVVVDKVCVSLLHVVMLGLLRLVFRFVLLGDVT